MGHLAGCRQANKKEMKGTYWPRATEEGLRQAGGRKKNGKGKGNERNILAQSHRGRAETGKWKEEEWKRAGK